MLYCQIRARKGITYNKQRIGIINGRHRGIILRGREKVNNGVKSQPAKGVHWGHWSTSNNYYQTEIARSSTIYPLQVAFGA